MYRITIQRATRKSIPRSTHLKAWVKTTLEKHIPAAELNLRIVDVDEMTELNTQYRKKSGPTNVLSFPFERHELDEGIPALGDVVLCADVVNREAEDQNKTQDAHWAHIVIHGTLHLLGYDHQTSKEADVMEAEEIQLLKQFHFPNPYL